MSKSKNRFINKKKESFLRDIAGWPSLEDLSNDLTIRCKFNFSYFDSSQSAGQKFSDWNHRQLCGLLEKIKEYTKKPLEYWQNERVGKGSLTILAIYGGFPPKSKFIRPKHVPHQAQWGRFRLGYKIRLIGFTIPAELHKTSHVSTCEFFDKNTFYVVFLDLEHNFYPPEDH